MTDISDMRRRAIYDRYHSLLGSGLARADVLQELSIEFSVDETTVAGIIEDMEPDPQPGD